MPEAELWAGAVNFRSYTNCGAKGLAFSQLAQ